MAPSRFFCEVINVSVTGFNRRRRELAAQQAAKSRVQENPNYKKEHLEELTVDELKQLCKEWELEGYKTLRKAELINLLSGGE